MFFRKAKQIRELRNEILRLQTKLVGKYYEGYSKGQKEVLDKLLKGTPNEIRKRFDLPPIQDGKKTDFVLIDDILKTQKVSVCIVHDPTVPLDRVKRMVAKELAEELIDYIDLKQNDRALFPYIHTSGSLTIVRSEKNCNT